MAFVTSHVRYIATLCWPTRIRCVGISIQSPNVLHVAIIEAPFIPAGGDIDSRLDSREILGHMKYFRRRDTPQDEGTFNRG